MQRKSKRPVSQSWDGVEEQQNTVSGTAFYRSSKSASLSIPCSNNTEPGQKLSYRHDGGADAATPGVKCDAARDSAGAFYADEPDAAELDPPSMSMESRTIDARSRELKVVNAPELAGFGIDCIRLSLLSIEVDPGCGLQVRGGHSDLQGNQAGEHQLFRLTNGVAIRGASARLKLIDPCCRLDVKPVPNCSRIGASPSHPFMAAETGVHEPSMSLERFKNKIAMTIVISRGACYHNE
jgi:hypothetical protein